MKYIFFKIATWIMSLAFPILIYNLIKKEEV
jgi:hypothetical protein